VVSILNGSYTAGRGPESVHPGHSANYSSGCQLYERRPPLDRLKCGAFNYEYPLGGIGTRERHVEVAGSMPTRQHPDHDILQLSFRLKTFAWEPRFDEEWFRTLRSIPTLPTVLLLGFGVWDMQYPAGGTPEAGVDAFEDALKTFLGRLEQTLRTKLRAIARAKGVPVRRLRKPRIYWLTVAAISSSKLPEWKKHRMNAGLAQRYNEVARPQLQRRGIEIIDTFSSTLANPLLSIDGVHFPGVVSKHHTQLFLRATCTNFLSFRTRQEPPIDSENVVDA